MRRPQRGRGLVEHEDLRAPGQRLGDLDELLVGDGQAAGGPVRAQGHTEPGEEADRLGVHRAPVDGARPALGLAADEDPSA